MAIFKCLQSGQTVTFTLQHDIDSMRGHAGYVRIDEESMEPIPPIEDVPKGIFLAPPAMMKKRGRPRKAV
jgi:hypothetical protein